MEQNNNVGLYEYKQNNIQHFDHLQNRTCSIKNFFKKFLEKKSIKEFRE